MKKFILLVILIGVLFYLGARYYYNTGLVIKEYTVKSEELPKGYNGFKIVHFTDILFSSDDKIKKIETIVNSINEQNADVIVFTGDLIKESITSDTKEKLTSILEKLKCTYKKYAILGDHDTIDSKEILEDSNFIILDNSSDYIYQNELNPLTFVGGDKLDNIEEDDSYKIVLIHKPDYFKKISDLDINLVLAGHSLGGQIRIPFYGSLIKKDGANIYTNDYYKENDSVMYVSYGIGNEKTNLRFLNKPSYNIYRLYSK